MNPLAVYIRIPRTGSTSLVQLCDDNDLDYYGGAKLKVNNPTTPAEAKKNREKALTLNLTDYVRGRLGFAPFVFSSVRNPWERAISIWSGPFFAGIGTFQDFCEKLRAKEFNINQAWHAVPMSNHLLDKKGILLVDYVVRFESIEEDVVGLCDKIGLPSPNIFHKNHSHWEKPASKDKAHKYWEYYNDRTYEIILEEYNDDIKYFGYKFENR